jgi:hypothetical protein
MMRIDLCSTHLASTFREIIRKTFKGVYDAIYDARFVNIRQELLI